MLNKVVYIIMLFIFCNSQTWAELIEVDYTTGGDRLITRDTSTGYDWLDLSETAGASFNDIISGDGGWLEDGFRYASNIEVLNLWNSQGIISIGGMGFNQSQQALVSLLQGMLGYTYVGPSHKETVGITSNPGTSIGSHNMAVLSSGNIPNTFYWSAIEWQGPQDNFGDIEVGSYLVRETTVVPVPPAVYMFISGLLCLLKIRGIKRADNITVSSSEQKYP